MRIRPGGAIAINSEDPPPPFFPFEPTLPPGFPVDTFMEYPSQVALLAQPLTPAEDLRPPEYRKAVKEQDLIRLAGKIFGSAAALLALLLVVQGYLLTTMTNKLNSLRQPPALLQNTLAEVRSAAEKRTAVEQKISLLNSRHAEPSLPALLASLNLRQLHGISIQSMSIKRDKEGILLTLNGTVSDPTLSGAQARFEELVQRLNSQPGVKTGTSSLDPKGQKFTLEARYTP